MATTTEIQGSLEPTFIDEPNTETQASDPSRGMFVSVDDSRGQLNRRISDALGQASIAAANEKYITGGRGGFAVRHDNQSFRRLIRAITVVFFVLPVAALTVYLVFISADQYQVESRFAIRQVSTPIGDILSSLGGGASANKSEAAIVAKYLVSEGMVRDLQKDVDIGKLFSASGDFLSRFDPRGPIEDLAKYWKWKVDATEDTSTGLITMKVAAFTPADAVLISKAAIARVEALVNSLSEQNKASIQDLAQKRLDRARDRLSEISGQMAQLRNRTGVLDSKEQSKAQATLVSTLELELAKMQATRASLSALSSESIRLRVLEQRIASLKQQIDVEKLKMTGSGDEVLSGVMTDFERLQVDQNAALKEFADAATVFEDARMGAERQELYVSVFMPPTIPESSTYPRRGLVWIVGFAIAAATTFALISLARVVRDNRAA